MEKCHQGHYILVKKGKDLDRLYQLVTYWSIGSHSLSVLKRSFLCGITFALSSELDVALKKLRSYTIKIFEWFHNNRLKSKAGKCNLVASSTSPTEIQIESTIISSVKRVKLLGVHIDGRLDFDYHVNQICKKASKKIHALSRVCKYMDQNKRRMLMKAFIMLQFSYCIALW